MSADRRRSIEIAMVEIPAGEIELRDDRVKKKWKAEVKPFLLARYPVTVGVYGELAGDAAAPPDGDSRLPVVNVSWLDTVKFCNLLSEREGLQPCYAMRSSGDVEWNGDADGYRLPTEAEWQYACKAGTAGYRYGELDRIAWYADNAGGNVHEAGGKEPNAWGLYDMLGNVWEWCWDLYDEEVYGPYRIFRGGSWAEEARGCGATCRRRSHPTFCIDDLGFRLARSIATR